GGNFGGPGIVRLDLREFLDRLLQRLGRLVALAGVAEPAGQCEIRLTDPVLGAAGQLVIGIAPQELTEPRDRERIAALAEVDIGRLVDVLGLERAGGRPRRYGCDGSGSRRRRR